MSLDDQLGLKCAPCWICLEDGPDENGEPLVRDCACRGETSAGYHLSCIIKYAGRKTRELEKKQFSELKNGSEVGKFWEICPNCNQAYGRSILYSLVDTMVDRTKHLPDTHWVRFSARMTWVDSHTSSGGPISRKKFCLIEKEIESLNKLIEEPELALGMFNIVSAGHPLVKAFRCVESCRLIRRLGMLYQRSGESEEALRYAEESVLKMKAAVSEGLPVTEELLLARQQLQVQKTMMGIVTEDDIQDQRNRLRELTTDAEIILAKERLAKALTQIDSPQYVEAIKLMDDVVARCERYFGPQHELSIISKQKQTCIKNGYRDYLMQLKASK